MSDGLLLDDPHSGQRFSSGSRVLHAGEIKRFARACDPQPFQLNKTAAAASLLAGLAASHWHTAALTTRPSVSRGAPIAAGVRWLSDP